MSTLCNFFLLTWTGPYLDMNRQKPIFLNYKFLDKRLVSLDVHWYDEFSYFKLIKILKNTCRIFEKKRKNTKFFTVTKIFLGLWRPLMSIYTSSQLNIFFRLSQVDALKIDFSIFFISNVFNTNYTWFCTSRLLNVYISLNSGF